MFLVSLTRNPERPGRLLRMTPTELDALSKLIYDSNIDAFLEATREPVELSGFDSRDSSVLHIAALVENMRPVIDRICERGVDVNLRDPNGRTPLMNAVNYRCPNNARRLIELGADIERADDEGATPLSTAASNGDLICAILLLDAGAKVDATGGKRSPLSCATTNSRSLPMIELLLARGADINFGDGVGTAIMGAISYEDVGFVRFFLDRGADITKPKNFSKETTMEFAERVGNAEVIAMLRAHLR